MTVPPTRFDRFFFIVTRLISLLLLLALLAGAVGIVYMWWFSGPEAERGAVKVDDNSVRSGKAVELSFSEADDINMADTQMIRLNADDGSGKFSYGRTGRTRNVLFVSGSDKPARWLFNDHKNVVWELKQLHKGAQCEQKVPTLALYVEYTAHEPGGEPKKRANEVLTVGLIRPDGSGFTSVLKGVARVVSHRVIDGQRVLIVFQRGTAIWQANISLADFTVTGEREIAKLPTAI